MRCETEGYCMTPADEEARKLLRLAQSDRDTFDYLMPANHLRDAVVLFHAQQSIEKAFKSVLTLHGVSFDRTHDLLALASVLSLHGIRPPYTPDEMAAFNPYAVLFRYDDEDIVLISRQEAGTMVALVLAWAEKIVEITGITS